MKKRVINKIRVILKNNNILKAGFFGSYSRNEETKNSDIDILVQLPKKSSLFTLSSIENELEKKLNKKIDLLTYDSINSKIKKQILNDEVRII